MQERRAKAEEFLKKLLPERYQTLREEAKTEMLARLPWLTTHEGKTAFEAMIRSQMIERFLRPYNSGVEAKSGA